MLFEGTKVVRIYNDKSKPDEVFYLNLRPSTGSMKEYEEYLEPAARYLFSLMKEAEKAETKKKQIPINRSLTKIN